MIFIFSIVISDIIITTSTTYYMSALKLGQNTSADFFDLIR